MEPNPFEPPSDRHRAGEPRSLAGDGIATGHLVNVKGNVPCDYDLYEDRLRIYPQEGPIEIARQDFLSHSRLIPVAQNVLLQTDKPQKVTFKIPAENLPGILAMLSPIQKQMLHTALRRLFGPVLLGIFGVWVVLEWLADQTVVELLTGGAAFGSLFLIFGIIARVAPHRVLFLAYACSWMYVTAYWLYRALNGDHWFSAVLIGFFALISIPQSLASFRLYGRPWSTEHPNEIG